MTQFIGNLKKKEEKGSVSTKKHLNKINSMVHRKRRRAAAIAIDPSTFFRFVGLIFSLPDYSGTVP